MPSNTDRTYIKDNLIVISSTFFVILSGYSFHFLAARKLGPAEYGLVVSLLSIVYLIDIFLQSSQSTITTRVAEAKTNNKEVFPIISSFLSKNVKYGLMFLAIFLLSIFPLARFLNTTNYFAIFMLSILIFASFLLPIARGFFQGMQQFWRLASTYFAEGATKILTLLALFSLGGAAASSVTSISLSYLMPFIISLPFLPRISFHKKHIVKYDLINDLTLLLMGLALFYSLDMALVKHFFQAHEAGLYSAASLYGKIIIFSAIPIAMVLLPKGVEANAKREKTLVLLKKSLIILLLICIPLLALYFAVPELIISLSLGTGYTDASKLIFYYGISSLFIAIAYIESFYITSLKKEKHMWIPITLIWLVNPIFITLNHSSLYNALAALLLSSALLVAFLSLSILRLKKAAKPI